MTREYSLQDAFNIKQSKAFYEKTIDIYGLFSIISELFEELGLLSEDIADKNKLSFKMVYPIDMIKTNNENIITFDLYSRSRSVVNGVTQNTPHIIHKAIDLVDGREKSLEAFSFTNTVLLHVYSTSSEKLYQILQTIELVFLQYKNWFNKNYRVKVVYDGIKTTAESHNLYHNRIYNKTICLTVTTEAQFEMNSEIVKNIDKTHN